MADPWVEVPSEEREVVPREGKRKGETTTKEEKKMIRKMVPREMDDSAPESLCFWKTWESLEIFAAVVAAVDVAAASW